MVWKVFRLAPVSVAITPKSIDVNVFAGLPQI